MKGFHFFLLTLLSAIWGGSFIFMRILAPIFGATGTACLRLTIAAFFLILYFKMTKYKIHLRRDWKILCIIGILNSAIPFTLYSYAALHIPASLSVIINSTSPMFGMLFAALILKERMNTRKVTGLILGIIGVTLISGSKSLDATIESYLAMAACVLAAFCYGLSGAIIKKYAKHVEPKAMAGGSQLFAGLSLMPFLLTSTPSEPITSTIAITVVSFAVLCSAVAYLIYYYLMKEIGPTKTLTVTFLMPVFGILWGFLLLKESLYPQMLLGMSVILLGTYLVTSVGTFRSKSI
jgi:drug/metabolite transporter (DMT)-like permease